MFKFFNRKNTDDKASFLSAPVEDHDFPLEQNPADAPGMLESAAGAPSAEAAPAFETPAAALPAGVTAEPAPEAPDAEPVPDTRPVPVAGPASVVARPIPDAAPPVSGADTPAAAACPADAEAPAPATDQTAPPEAVIQTEPYQTGEAAGFPLADESPQAAAPAEAAELAAAETEELRSDKAVPCTWKEAVSETAPDPTVQIAAPEETVSPPGESPPTTRLDPQTIPKFAHALIKPPVYCPVGSDDDETEFYVVDISQFKQQVLPPGYPETTVWGYGGTVRDGPTGHVSYSRSSPGATFEAIRHIPIKVRWVNKLIGKHLFAVDPTLHWANPNDMPMDPPKPWPPYPPGFPDAQRPVPTVTHLHGGETSSISDGHPDAWFTASGIKGPAFCTSMVTYPNGQEPTTLWYHDHAMGMTRLNVYAGLAGFYLLRDRRELCRRQDFELPGHKYEIPIVIQDRSFNTDGSLWFTETGVNPDIHPYWDPEFFGDAIMVNGRVWPNLDVERRQYRFRLLNGSNARFYRLRFSNGMGFIQIGTDGGFLPRPGRTGDAPAGTGGARRHSG